MDLEPFPLPMSAREAYRFTIDGFYRCGSIPTFSHTLRQLRADQRMAVLNSVMLRVGELLESFTEPPFVINVVAKKPVG